MAPTCAHKKKPKKGRRGGIQASLLSKLGHGVPKATKKMKKGEQAPSQAPFLSNLGYDVLEATKKTKEASSHFIES